MSYVGSPFQFRAPPPAGFLAGVMRDALPPSEKFSDAELGHIEVLRAGAERLAMEVEAFSLDAVATAATLRALGISPVLAPDIAALRRDRDFLPIEPTPEQRERLDAMPAAHQAIAGRAMARVDALRAAFDRAIARLETEAHQPMPAGRPLIERAFEAYARALHEVLPIEPIKIADVDIFRGEEGGVIVQMTLRASRPIGPAAIVGGWRDADRRVWAECPEAVGLFAYRMIDAKSDQAA